MPDGVKQMAPIISMHHGRGPHHHLTADASVAVDMHAKLQAAEQRALAQARKSENLIAYFGGQLRRLTEQLQAERAASRSARAAGAPGMEHVVRALLRFESKLRAEQSAIRQQMHDKDAQLNRLHREIVVLRERHNDRTATPDLHIDRIAQFCPACRKEYHLIHTKSVAVQSVDCGGHADGGGGGATNSADTSGSSMATASAGTTTTTDTSSTHSVEYLSSSEEGASLAAASFLEARRSKKYMSKRTSGTFRDYLRSRSTDPSTENQQQQHATNPLMRRLSDVSHRAGKGGIGVSAAGDPRSILKPTLPSVRRANSLHNTSSTSSCNGGTGTGSGSTSSNSSIRSVSSQPYSAYINDVHGLRPMSAEPATSPISRMSEREQIVEEAEREEEEEAASATTSLAAAQPDDGDDEVFGASDGFTAKSKTLQAVSGFESTDDWYASVSDMEDSDNAPTKPYAYNAVNPVLECVNQILLQQSMDCTLESSSPQHSSPDASRHPNAPTTAITPSPPSSTSSLSPSSSMHKDATGGSAPPKSQKRVHFSTQNSMVQVPRADSFHYIEPSAVPPLNHYNHHNHHQHHHYQQHHMASPVMPAHHQHHQSHHQHQFSYESVYSNEYEPIGSEGTCSVATTNHYVDMDSKHYAAAPKPANTKQSNAYGGAGPVTPVSAPSLLPPALPPKPSNLMKIRNVPRLQQALLLPPSANVLTELTGEMGAHHNSDTDTEPDYASILEIGPIASRPTATDSAPASVRQVQVLVDVHQAAADTSLSSSSSSSSKDSLLDSEQMVKGRRVHPLQPHCDIIDGDHKTSDAFGCLSAEDDETSFADVPKLPNVAAIISPKKEQVATVAVTAAATGAVITQDNYITRSGQTVPIMAEVSTVSPVTAHQQTPTLPAKIIMKNLHNRLQPQQQQQSHQPKPPAKPSAKLMVTPSAALYEDKMRIQAEFDWYNLDVEYSGVKSSKMLVSGHASDRLIDDNKDVDDDDDDEDDDDDDDDDDDGDGDDNGNNVGHMNGNNRDAVIDHLMLLSVNESKDAQSFGVEYKLDEEFSYSNGPYTNALLRMHSTPNGVGAGSGNANDGTAHFVGRSLSHAQETIPEDDRDDEDDDDADDDTDRRHIDQIGKQILPETTTPKMRRVEASMRHCDSAADAFETFLSETGLATKPLPRKRRIFY